MVHVFDRKRIVKSIGVASLGLGLLASSAGVSSTLAQEHESTAPGIDLRQVKLDEGAFDLDDEELKELLILLLQERVQENEGALGFRGDVDARDVGNVRMQRGEHGSHEDLRAEAYNEFTQALAEELGIDDADEIDAAIRNAMMSVVDSNDGLTEEGAEVQKALIAAADVPIGPAYRGHGG